MIGGTCLCCGAPDTKWPPPGRTARCAWRRAGARRARSPSRAGTGSASSATASCARPAIGAPCAGASCRGGGSVPAREATSAVAAETSIDLLDSIEPRLDRYLRETDRDRAELLAVVLSPRVSVDTKASLLRAILRVHMRSFLLANLRRMWRRRQNAIVG